MPQEEKRIKQPNRKNNSAVDVSLYHWTSQVKKKKKGHIYTYICVSVCVRARIYSAF